MKAIPQFSLFVLLLLGLWACEDEAVIRLPELQEGANLRIVVDATKNAFKVGSIASSTVEFDAYSINTNLQKVEWIGHYISQKDTIKKQVLYTLQPSAFTKGVARGVITSADVVRAFKLANPASIKAGDKIALETHVTLTDGRVINPSNSAPSIRQGASASFTAFLNIAVQP